MDKTELLQKIKALAEQGSGGEKENAQKILADLMKKYKIKDEDLVDEVITDHPVRFKSKYERALINQVTYSVLGDKYFEGQGTLVYKNSRIKELIIRCTSADFIEIKAKIEFYYHHFEKELKLFYDAFIRANDIYPPDNKISEKYLSKDEYTEEDYQAMRLARNLEKHNYNLQIEDKK